MNIKKMLSLAAVLTCAAAFQVHAQNPRDTSWIECTYDFRYLKDTTLRMAIDGSLVSGDADKLSEETVVLQIGNKGSRYIEYRTYRSDSLALAFEAKTGRHINKRTSDAIDMVYKDKENGVTILTETLGLTPFMYSEASPDFGWKVEEEWKEIAGYNACKATCSFRGRDYVAWFSPEIPVSDGPWKFQGLPGLILEVYDEPCQYWYSVKGIREAAREICVPKEKYEKIDDLAEYLRIKRWSIENAPEFVSYTSPGPVWVYDEEGNEIDPSEIVHVMEYDFQEIIPR